jgi:regulator of protease activity HflC (stomatin/prohibitin superfamily)
MADEQMPAQPAPNYNQLTQVRVPLDEAADAFTTRDANGCIPIVVLPQGLNRIHNQAVMLGVVILIAGIVGGILLNNSITLVPLAIVIALLLFVLGVYRSFIVPIPEGANGLLSKGGRYSRTIDSGTHIIPPWIAVSHLVTRREIPFDVPVVEALTQDGVRANVDMLVIFSITEPYRFVYHISADDFDLVLQASCQDALRTIIRQITSEQVADLARQDLVDLQARLSATVESYGVTMMRVTITYAQPPTEFVQVQEARQLAILQRAEQAERQILAQRRQADAEALTRQQVVAQVECDREALQSQIQQAESRRRVVELEAETEALRLAKLEERLRAYPAAAEYEWQSEQLAVARALAGNTRAMLQVGNANDIVRAFTMRDFAQSLLLPATDDTPASSPTKTASQGNGAPEPEAK